MKIQYYLIFVLFLTTQLLQAQPRGQWQNMTADSIAAQTTMMMVDSLNLSTAQEKKIYAVNLDHAQKQKALRKEFIGDREGIRTGMQLLRSEHHTALVQFLTTDQMDKWKSIQQERRKKRQHQGERKAAERRKKSQDRS